MIIKQRRVSLEDLYFEDTGLKWNSDDGLDKRFKEKWIKMLIEYGKRAEKYVEMSKEKKGPNTKNKAR